MHAYCFYSIFNIKVVNIIINISRSFFKDIGFLYKELIIGLILYVHDNMKSIS